MAKLTIGDKTVQVGDDFLNLSPQEQQAVVDEIASSLGFSEPAGGSSVNQQNGEQPAPEPRGFMGTLRDNVLGDDDPTTQNFGEKLGTALNKAGEAMTFGLIGDEASAAVESVIPGVDYADRRDHYRDQEALLEQTNPGVALGAEVGGALAGAAVPIGAASRVAGAGAGLGRRMVGSALLGGAGGATYGFMEGEGLEDRANQAQFGGTLGGAVGAAVPVLGAGIQKVANNRAARRAIREAAEGAPTTEQLRQQGRAAYQAIDDANVQIRPEAFANTRKNIVDALRSNTGFDELPGPGSLTPNSARTMQIMEQAQGAMSQDPTAALPFRSLDQMRRQAGAAAGNMTNRADSQAGMQIIEGLDDAVRNLGPDDVVSGDVQTLQEMLPKARDVWSRMTRSQMVDDAIESGQNNYLSGGASGIRNQFARILRSDKLSRGFSDAEKGLMRRVVNGSAPEQLLNLLGGGLGQLGQIGAGFGMGGLPGAAAGMATSALARKGSEALSSRNAEIVRAIIANGGMQALPQASDAARRITESLTRRIAATTPQ